LKTDVYEIAETLRQYYQKLYSKEDIEEEEEEEEEELEINESDNMEEPNILKMKYKPP